MERIAMEPVRRGMLPISAVLAGNAVSLVGNQVTGLAIPWFVLQTTGSPAQTGLTAAVTALPTVIGGVFGGAAIDRLGHKRASIAADLASGATEALIPLLQATSGLPLCLLLALAFLGALLDLPGGSARLSLMPDLSSSAGIGPERANAALQTVSRAAQPTGPLLAGLIIAAHGPGNALWVDATSFAVSATLVAIAVPAPVPCSAEPRRGTRYFGDLGEGWRVVRRDRLLATLLTSSAILDLLAAPLFGVVLPVSAKSASGGSISLSPKLGGFGAGTLTGTLLNGAVGHRLPRRASYVGGILVSAVSFLLLAPLSGPIATTAALAAIGVGIGLIDPLLMTVAHERVPAKPRARFFGLMVAVAWAAMPVGILAIGYLLEAVGLRLTLFATTVAYLVFGLGLLINPTPKAMDRSTAKTDGQTKEQPEKAAMGAKSEELWSSDAARCPPTRSRSGSARS